MRSNKFPLSIDRIAFVVLILAGAAFAAGPVEKVIYKFVGPPDGRGPVSSLVADAAGNLYGTTAYGGIGTYCCGTVFELSPPATGGGSWTETVLYTFQGGADGDTPVATLLLDKLGNLYGTTGDGAKGARNDIRVDASQHSRKRMD